MNNGEWVVILTIIGPLGVLLWGLVFCMLYGIYKDLKR